MRQPLKVFCFFRNSHQRNLALKPGCQGVERYLLYGMDTPGEMGIASRNNLEAEFLPGRMVRQIAWYGSRLLELSAI